MHSPSAPKPSVRTAHLEAADFPWRDTTRPAEERADALIAEMTLREKLGQLYGIWVGASNEGGDVAPYQHEMEEVVDLDQLLRFGLGHLTRPFGSRPVDAAVGVIGLAKAQLRIADASRFGIPAIAHEECLAGFTAWGATAYPVPLSWGATFDPGLIEQMAKRIGTSMRAIGVHQGLAPILDVVRDYRWGRVEECIGEDPYLVSVTAAAYVRGLESTGVIATLKHFVGYSASQSGRNLAPVSIGPREVADLLLPPFEFVIREGAARSVMHSYTDSDGIPCAADSSLLTTTLRDAWEFSGTVVADYTGITFLKTLHGVAETIGEAGGLALEAGVDIELPTVDAYGDPLADEVAAGRVDEALIDRALKRALTQKIGLGLLDPGWDPLPDGWDRAALADPEQVRGRVDLDPPADRALAREIAERAVVLLANDGTLPISSSLPTTPKRITLIGPSAGEPLALLGCYAFPNHVLARNPGVPMLIEVATLAEAVRAEFPHSEVTCVKGVDFVGNDKSGIPAAVAAAVESDLTIVTVGDLAGMFGKGTSGEGCDAPDLSLPGQQWPLLDAVLSAGSAVVTVVVSGRPYALHDTPDRSVGVIQAFLPGEEGAAAIAGVISGRVNPAGRLPVSVPATPGGQPSTYLSSALARATRASNLDPTPLFSFGHGLSYHSSVWANLRVGGVELNEPVGEDAIASIDTQGSVEISIDISNMSHRQGVETVQIYLHDPVATVVRPVMKLIGFASVKLEPAETKRAAFSVHADLTSFTGRSGQRIVEPGRVELHVAASSSDIRFSIPIDITGPTRPVDHRRVMTAPVVITDHTGISE